MRSRLSENLSSSQEQEVEKTDTSSNDEADEIAEPLEGVPRLRRENAVQVTEKLRAAEEHDVYPRGRQMS